MIATTEQKSQPEGPGDAGAPEPVVGVTPELLAGWLARDEAVLVDVREDYEHAEERIAGAELCPLSAFDAEGVRSAHAGRRAVFQCRTGHRSLDAAERFRTPGETVFHLAGGIEAWKGAGHPVVRAPRGPVLPLMRQVQVIAGSLVLLGVVLGLTASPWFFGLSGFVGAGLTFAGLSGWCGMARLLAVMPWNAALRASSGATAPTGAPGTPHASCTTDA